MQLQIESTNKIEHLGGVPCRVWQGFTPKGAECTLYVVSICIPNAQDNSEFAEALADIAQPPALSYYQRLMARSIN